MALLDMAFKAGLVCIIVHVNYHLRESAQRDQALVENYGALHKLKVFLFDAPLFKTGNFQKQAREYRYEKMAQVCLSQNADAILVAHHQDDDIETVLMQQRRQSDVEWLGLQEVSTMNHQTLIRPLLDFTKADLIHYCDGHGIEYGLDESNESLNYERNRVRKECVHLSRIQKEELLNLKKTRNDERRTFLSRYQDELKGSQLSLQRYQSLMMEWPSFLFEWLRAHAVSRPLSKDYLKELHRQCCESQSLNLRIGSCQLIKHYDNLLLTEPFQAYRYTLEEAKEYKTPYFNLSFRNGEGFSVDGTDFPLTIRSALGSELVPGKTRSKTLNRWFIEHKIKVQDRKQWPVVLNAKDEVIFIPKCGVSTGLRPNKIHLYMIK